MKFFWGKKKFEKLVISCEVSDKVSNWLTSSLFAISTTCTCHAYRYIFQSVVS